VCRTFDSPRSVLNTRIAGVVFPGVRSPRLNRREFPSFGYHSELRPAAWREIDLDCPTCRPTAEARGRAFRRFSRRLTQRPEFRIWILRRYAGRLAHSRPGSTRQVVML
jgi:hypothetical protein